MKNMKLNAAKSLIIIALACPFAFADGDQGSGGFAGNDDTVISSCEASLDGDQGSGGLTAGPCEEMSYIDTVAASVFGYFESIF